MRPKLESLQVYPSTRPACRDCDEGWYFAEREEVRRFLKKFSSCRTQLEILANLSCQREKGKIIGALIPCHCPAGQQRMEAL